MGRQTFDDVRDFLTGSAFTYKRMTAGPGSVVRERPKPVAVWPKTTVAMEKSWDFGRYSNVARDPRHPAFTRLKPGSVIVTSEEEVDNWLSSAWNSYSSIDWGKHDAIMYASEAEHWKKLTVQLGRTFDFFINAAETARHDIDIPSDFERALDDCLRQRNDRLLEEYGTWEAVPEKRADPSLTNSGWPVFGNHPLAKVVGGGLFPAQIDALKTEDYFRQVQKWASFVGLEPSTACCYGVATRQGPVYKDLEQRTSISKGLTTQWSNIGTWKGHYSRARIVYMACSGVNNVLEPLFRRLERSRELIAGLWRRTATFDGEYVADLPLQYEGDLSGYDASITRSLQRSVVRAIKRVWPDLSAEADFWLRSEELGLLTPSADIYSGFTGRCDLQSKLGGISSGIKTTSSIGTLINEAALTYAIRSIGFPDWIVGSYGGLRALVQGDDVCIRSSHHLSAEGINEAYARLGLKNNLILGDTFLSKHITLDGTTVPIAGRLVQQTLSNEKEYAGPDSDGIVLLGAIGRFTGAEFLPEDLQQAVWSAIRETSWLRTIALTSGGRAITSFPQLMTRLKSVDVQTNGFIQNSLRTREGNSWLYETLRAAEHSPVSWTLTLLPNLEYLLAEGLGQDEDTRKVIRNIKNLDDPHRWQILREAYFTCVSADRRSMDSLFDQFVGRYGSGRSLAPDQTIVYEKGANSAYV